MQNDSLTHLKRITLWNGKNYNPQADEFFIEDALWLISLRIKPYILTKQEKECLITSLKNANSGKSARKLIRKIEKHYLKK